MSQTLVLHKGFYESVIKKIDILKNHGYNTIEEFINGIIKRLNNEYSYLEIDGYRFLNNKEKKTYYQYAAFIEGDIALYKRIDVFFTPIDSKPGDIIIEQSLMPTICTQMNNDITFLLNEKYKKIVLLTSQVNKKNEIDIAYNKMQMDINSLNTLNFDVIPFFPIKNLSTDTKFNSLIEYLDMSNLLQKLKPNNSQVELMWIKNDVLFGNCERSQLEGQFFKSFCFRYLTAIFSGLNDYKYNIDSVLNKLGKIDNQFSNLKSFVDYANSNILYQTNILMPADEDVVESDDDIDDFNDKNRQPQKAYDSKGRKKYKTQKKIRDYVLKQANYICGCHNDKHFYFESVALHNYVEGHHIIPMNRQEEYYFNYNINLDIADNIIALCPNCHCQIHLGSKKARLKILGEIFVRNFTKLRNINEKISLSLLASYYNIGITEAEERELLKDIKSKGEN